jgi:hypothetical protein
MVTWTSQRSGGGEAAVGRAEEVRLAEDHDQDPPRLPRPHHRGRREAKDEGKSRGRPSHRADHRWWEADVHQGAMARSTEGEGWRRLRLI